MPVGLGVRVAMQEFEIELALTKPTDDSLHVLERELSSSFHLEDRTHSGWGLVISSNRAQKQGLLEDAVLDFLKELMSVERTIKASAGILRIAVYNDAVTCTLRLHDFRVIVELGLKLEITIYPVE